MKSKPLALLALGIGLVVVAWLTGALGRLGASLKSLLLDCLEYIQGLDPTVASLTFVALYIAATVLFVPGLLITMAAGLLFGLVHGSLLVSVASVAGASLAFLIGRYLARDWVTKKVSDNSRFLAIDEAIGAQGAKVVFLLRLSPIFPFNLLNYTLGLTRVSFGQYVLASWIGMLPGTVMYVYLGSLAGSVAELAAGREEKTPGQWALLGVGLIATIAVTLVITRLAKRALDERLSTA